MAKSAPQTFKDKLLRHKKKALLGFFFALGAAAFFGAGAFFGMQSWRGSLYISLRAPAEGRKIASADDSAQGILSLSIEEIAASARDKLFGGARADKNDSMIEFYLGSFLVRSPFDESPQLICNAYSFVEMTFAARGAQLSGERGLMLVQSPCRQKDQSSIGPFLIPEREILDHPDQRSFSIPEEEILIRFYNAAISLMPDWILTDARFFNSPEEAGFIVQFVPEENPIFELEISSAAGEAPVPRESSRF